MKTSTMHARNLGPTISRITVALVFASVIGGLAMSPALARDNDRRDDHWDKGRHKDESHFDRGRRGHPQPRYQARPVYVPPPVYYAPPPVYYPPPQSPGITFFFPLDIRIR
jgi:hypothetical protein